MATWATTRSRQAPQLILLALLYLITINLSLPLRYGGVGLVPIVSIGSLLVLGPQLAFYLLLGSAILAEAIRPIWDPIWEFVTLEPASLATRIGYRIGRVAILALALVASTEVLQLLSGERSFSDMRISGIDQLEVLVGVSLTYGVIYTVGNYSLWLTGKHSRKEFPLMLTAFLGALLHPFSFLGGIVFWRNGMPAFVIFCLGVMVSSVVFWLYWQRGYSSSQRLYQFSFVNRVGETLRETLDLEQILDGILEHLRTLFPREKLALYLLDEETNRLSRIRSVEHSGPLESFSAAGKQDLDCDQFVGWVVEYVRTLRLDGSNMHFGPRHGLVIPQPTPDAWLGVPLISGSDAIGAMVIQRFGDERPFTQWNEEMLVAIGGHASAAIHNARQHGRTLELYDLADEELSRRIEQLQALVYAMNEGVLMLNTEGRVILVNPVMVEMLGVTPTSLDGTALASEPNTTRIGYDSDQFAFLLKELSVGDAPSVKPVTYELAPRDSTAHRYILRTEAPVKSVGGDIMGWLMLFRDVTEEQELADLRTDLTRMVIHDLRNPLTTLASTIDIAEDRLRSEDHGRSNEVKTLLSQARRSGAEMLDLVDSLMDISKMEAGQAVVEADAMRMNVLAKRIVNQLQPLAQQKNIEIKLEHSADLSAAWADDDMIRRVMTNLLDNALKHTPLGGSVCISLSSVKADDSRSSEVVKCAIKDTGPGIPAAFRDRLFDRFMRSNRGGSLVRGSGLGLTFCKLAIEAHGGRIWVEDVPDGGACFVFTLPGIPRFN